MDVNQSQLIEIALNALGYLAGGGIMIVLASMLKRQKDPTQPATTDASTSENRPVAKMVEKTVSSPEPKETGANFQFIDLSAATTSQNEAAPQPVAAKGRRNRQEVYEMARQMLSDKKSNEEISSRLPLSEAELSLLRVRNNQDKGAQNGQR